MTTATQPRRRRQTFHAPSPRRNAVGDFDHNGVVDFSDFTTVLQNYNASSTNSSWIIAERFVYSPYGVTTTLNPDFTVRSSGDYFAWNVGFQGMLFDSTTELNFTETRVYEASTGRFLTVDPARADGMNWYRGFAGNPINRRDPTGESWSGVLAGWIWGGVTTSVSTVEAGVKTVAADIGSTALSVTHAAKMGLRKIEIGIDNILAKVVIEGPIGAAYLSAVPSGHGGVYGKGIGVSGSFSTYSSGTGGVQIEAVVLKDACKVCFYIVPSGGPGGGTVGANGTVNFVGIAGLNVPDETAYKGFFTGWSGNVGVGGLPLPIPDAPLPIGYVGLQGSLVYAPAKGRPGLPGMLPSAKRPIVVSVASQVGLGTPGGNLGLSWIQSYGILLGCLPLK